MVYNRTYCKVSPIKEPALKKHHKIFTLECLFFYDLNTSVTASYSRCITKSKQVTAETSMTWDQPSEIQYWNILFGSINA